MKFNSISYSNYRCFLDGTISFDTNSNKNMTVIIAPNGGGKTETLFSFWWTLYGFDFSSLRNKDQTPYAINSELYRNLENGPVNNSETCSVTLEFEQDDKKYILTRGIVFAKKKNRIDKSEFKELKWIKENGETTLTITDSEQIEKILKNIIPEKILNGIIFDGERMQDLSSSTESSVEAIQSVINDISNLELIKQSELYFKSVLKKYNSELKRINKKINKNDLTEIINNLTECESKKSKLSSDYNKFKNNFLDIENKLKGISNELLKIEEIKNIELKRKNLKQNLDSEEKINTELYKNFFDLLINSYFLASSKILSDVSRIVDDHKIPKGLNIEVVESILENKAKKCICGKPLDLEALTNLKQLLQYLPPDNIDSTLLEIVRGITIDIDNIKLSVGNKYIEIQNNESQIKKLKNDIAAISVEISSMDESGKNIKRAASFEEKRNEYIEKRGSLKCKISDIEVELLNLNKKILELQNLRSKVASENEKTSNIDKKISFIDKCLEAMKSIKETNIKTALEDVNEKISAAYPLLSEDYSRGRRIYIVQYDKDKQYQMVVYMKNDVFDLINTWKENGEYEEYLSLGLNEKEIKEKAILKCIDSNSTGQSKINTFAFVKAILDYSNNPKKDSGYEKQKQYPLLIDAPFGDIASDNLKKSSSELHNFSHQVILLIDEDKYNSLRKSFDPYTSEKYRFIKIDGKNHSIIEKEC